MSLLSTLDWIVTVGARVLGLARDLPKPAKPVNPDCTRGLHSFSWREAGQPCRYCGEPPKPVNPLTHKDAERQAQAARAAGPRCRYLKETLPDRWVMCRLTEGHEEPHDFPPVKN